MRYQIYWSRPALKAARRLSPDILQRVTADIERYAATGYGDVKRLNGTYPSAYRLRSGNWRVIFDRPNDAPGTIQILDVMSRQDDYRP